MTKEEFLIAGNFISEDGQPFMVRCPECRKENWTPAVAAGKCAWCGTLADFGEEHGTNTPSSNEQNSAHGSS